MRVESTTLVPSVDTTVYIVLDDFGKIGRSYRETDETRSDLDAVVSDILSEQFKRPLRVVAFNTAEGGFALRPRTEPKTDLASWVHLPVARITLDAQRKVDIPFAVTVPANATPGEMPATVAMLYVIASSGNEN